MTRRQVLDGEGKPIDPAANLGDFLQAIPQSDLIESAVAAPTWETVTFDVDDPDLKGKTGKDAVALLAQTRAAAKQQEERAADLEKQLAQERQKSEIESTTRRVLQEQQAKPQVPETPQEDPRYAKVDELWFTDPPEARKLLNAINADIADDKAKAAEERAVQRVTRTMDETDKRRTAHQSFDVAFTTLKTQGIELDQIKAAAILQLVGNPQYAYFHNDGLYKPENLIGAAHTLFGRPQAPAAPAPAAAAPVQQQQVQAPMVVPPGSGRPAPAAAPARRASTAADPRTTRDYEHMAEIFNLDKDKLLARRAARIQREGDH